MRFPSKSRVRIRLFLSYAAAFTFLLTLVFGVGYAVFADRTIANQLETHRIASDQMSLSVAERLDRPMKIAIQFNLSKWVERMTYTQKNPEDFEDKLYASEFREQYQQIKLLEVSAGAGEQIGLYFALIDRIISNYGSTTWANYGDFYALQSPDNVLASAQLLRQNHQQSMISHCYMTINGEKKQGIVFLQTLPLSELRSSNVTMFYFLPIPSLSAQALS